MTQQAADTQRAYDLAIAHHQAGRLREADALYRQVLGQQPDHAGAMHRLGMLAHQIGRSDAAVGLLQRAAALAPAEADVHNNLGVALAATGRHAEAADAYRRALAIRPDFAEACNNLGSALRELGRLDEAIASYRRAIGLRPDYGEAYRNLGHALRERRGGGQPREAIGAYEHARGLMPASPEVLNDLGAALQDAGEAEQASDAIREALSLRPDFPEAHCNLAIALADQGRLDEAIAEHRRAIALRPDFAEAYKGLGNALKDTGELDAAVAAYEHALALRPQFAEAEWGLGFIYLLRGDFARGWPLYEARRRIKSFWGDRQIPRQMWDGSPLAGRRILLHAEQGLGDTIQFIRYAPRVASRGARVIVHCQPQLKRLLSGGPGIEHVISAGDAIPDFDVHCPLLSLPHLFGTTLADIPADVPYLEADPAALARWQARVDAEPAAIKVGLNWAGNPMPRSNRKRSIPLAAFAPLARVPGVRSFSLQTGDPAREAQAPPAGMEFVDWAGELTDLAETAGLIASLDLVITCDTSVAHLAGALGKPVWVALPFAADWRWLLGRADSPWYPTMRLFRQPSPGDWHGSIVQIAAELQRIPSMQG